MFSSSSFAGNVTNNQVCLTKVLV